MQVLHLLPNPTQQSLCTRIAANKIASMHHQVSHSCECCGSVYGPGLTFTLFAGVAPATILDKPRFRYQALQQQGSIKAQPGDLLSSATEQCDMHGIGHLHCVQVLHLQLVAAQQSLSTRLASNRVAPLHNQVR